MSDADDDPSQSTREAAPDAEDERPAEQRRNRGPRGGAAAAPVERPSTAHSTVRSSMPGSADETHRLYIEIANLQMSKARQKRIRDALEEQVEKCRREIANARERTETLKARAEANDDSRPGDDSRPDDDETSPTAAETDDTDTFRY